MKHAILFFFSLCLSFLLANAQQPQLIWANSFGSSGTDMSRISELDSEGNVITIGEFQQSVDFDPGSQDLVLTTSNSSYFIQKLNEDGDLIWVKQLDADIGNVISLTTDNNNNVIIAGHFATYGDFDPGSSTTTLTSEGQTDVFVLKLNSAGDFQWVKQLGDTQSDLCHTVVCDNSGNIYIAGRFGGSVDFDPNAGQHELVSQSSSDGFVLKLNSDGNFNWVSQFPDLGSAMYTNQTLAADNNGHVFFTGSFWNTIDVDPGAAAFELTSAGQRDVFIVALSEDGSFQWARQFGNTGSDHCHSLAADDDGGVYLCGSFFGLVDFDPGSGSYEIASTGGSADYFLLKLDADGDYQWVDTWNVATCGNIAVDADKNVYLGGGYVGTTDFDPGLAQNLIDSQAQSWDGFYLKLNSSGEFIWVATFGSDEDEFCQDLIASTSGSLYASGYYELACDFDPDSNSDYSLTSEGLEDAFIMRVGEQVVQSIADVDNTTFGLFPNPSNGALHLAVGVELSSSHIIVYDAAGNQVLYQRLAPAIQQVELQLPDKISPGLLLISLFDKGELVGTQRVMIQ